MNGNTAIRCEWADCQLVFSNAEDLYTHLSDDHVGRKSTNNLCLTCQWNNCGTVSAKRDHLASHLRVHLPLKPHECPLCHKGFKRPQDLKKHERIHTAEHQASLLSNQPGYKPVRRRRKNAASTGKTLKSMTTKPKLTRVPPKDFSARSSDLSYSPSFSHGDSISSNDYTLRNMDLEEENPYNTGYLDDPLQNFIDDVLQNQALPNYDTEMMDRLNSIAPILQYENSNWTLPCEPEAIPALQTWLEQLSSNIYPKQEQDMLTTPSMEQQSALLTPPTHETQEQVQLLLNDDYAMYPKLDTNNLWTSPYPQPTSASESSAVYTPPASDTLSQKSEKPQLWSPGYIHSPLYNNVIKEESSSETPVFRETGLTRSNPVVPSIDSSSMVSFDNKKEIMHMMNVFSSSDDIKYKPKTEEEVEEPKKEEITKETTTTTTTTATTTTTTTTRSASSDIITQLPAVTNEPEINYPSLTDHDIHKEPSDTEDQNLYPVDYQDESGSEEYTDEEEDIASPYANLVELVGQMKIEDEKTLRERHAALIDQLLQALSRVA